MDAAAAWVKDFKPKIVYPYHYDQDWVSRLTNGRGVQPPASAAATAASLQVFRDALTGGAIETRGANWYPADRQTGR